MGFVFSVSLILGGFFWDGHVSGKYLEMTVNINAMDDRNAGLFREEHSKDQTSPFVYEQFPIHRYQIDVTSQTMENQLWKLSDEFDRVPLYMTTLFWFVIAYLMNFVSDFVSQAFSTQLFESLLDTLDTGFLTMEKEIWDPLQIVMIALTIGWSILYWITRRTMKMWHSLFTMIGVVAISTFIFTNIGSYLKVVNELSTQISIQVLSGFASSIDQRDAGVLQQRAIENENDLNLSVKKARDTVFQMVVVIPYQLINFGSEINGEDLKLILQENKQEQRQKMIDRIAYDRAKYPIDQVRLLHKENQAERFAITMVVFFCLLITAFGFAGMSLMIVMWQLVAIGRALLVAFYLLLSLWPEYGFTQFLHWGWSLIQAVFMKVFYSVVMGVYLMGNFVIFNNLTNYGYMTASFLSLALSISLWIAVNELRKKVSHLPIDMSMLNQQVNSASKIGNQILYVGKQWGSTNVQKEQVDIQSRVNANRMSNVNQVNLNQYRRLDIHTKTNGEQTEDGVKLNSTKLKRMNLAQKESRGIMTDGSTYGRVRSKEQQAREKVISNVERKL